MVKGFIIWIYRWIKLGFTFSHSSNNEPLHYVLLFHWGDDGWHYISNWYHHSRCPRWLELWRDFLLPNDFVGALLGKGAWLCTKTFLGFGNVKYPWKVWCWYGTYKIIMGALFYIYTLGPKTIHSNCCITYDIYLLCFHSQSSICVFCAPQLLFI